MARDQKPSLLDVLTILSVGTVVLVAIFYGAAWYASAYAQVWMFR